MWTRSVLGISGIGVVVVAAAIGTQTVFGLAQMTVEFQDGAGNPKLTFVAGETVQAYVLDDSLGTVATSSATWSGPGSLVPAGTWWSIATGAPGPSSFALASGSAYNTTEPALSPLTSPPTAKVDGLPALIADFQATTGQFKLLFDVETTSVLAVSFAFEVVDAYPAPAHRVRVTSTSDVGGEWLAATEVAGEADASPHPSSGLFKAVATLSAASSALAPGDGAVYVQVGDDVALAYYDSGGSWLDGQTATVAATPTIPVAEALGYAVLAAILAAAITWKVRRPAAAL